MGFTCSQSASNAPSQPARRVSRPLWIGYVRSAGNAAPAARPVTNTVTESCGASTCAQCSADSAGPTISSCPCDA